MKDEKGKQNIIRMCLLFGVIGLLLLTVINSIYVNPGDSIVYEIDSPLETYTWENPYNVSRIIIAPTYIVFNNTGFNVTSIDPINIEINTIKDNITDADDINIVLLNFTVANPASATWFNISGFKNSSIYKVYADAVLHDTVTANSTGCISFYDIPSWNEVYTVYWSSDYTPPTNNAPVLSNPFPSNGSVDISAAGSPVNINCVDADGDLMRTDVWTNASGTWTQVAGWDVKILDTNNYSRWFIDDYNDDGSVNYQDYGLWNINEGWENDGIRGKWYEYLSYDNHTVSDDWGMTKPSTTYWWGVNCTDNTSWTNETYHFTTAVNYPPNITRPYPVDGAIDINVATGTQINANLTDADGDTMNVSVWSNFTGSWVQITYPEGESDPDYFFMDDYNNDNPHVWNYLDFSYWNSHKYTQDNGTYGFYDNNTVTDEWGMETPSTTYYWQVRANDGYGTSIETYSFTTGVAPGVIVETLDATGVEEDEAYLSGRINYNELGVDLTVRFEYWKHGDSTVYETVNQTVTDAQGNSPFYSYLSLPIAGALYQCRAVADNGFGIFYGENITFVSKPNEHASMTLTNTTTGFNISWVDPASGNINNSVLVYNTDHIPTSRTDGTVLYNDTGNYYNHTNLTGGVTYYYSIWSLAYYYPIYQWSDTYVSASQYFVDDPVVTTGDVTGLGATNCTLHGTLIEDGGESCTTWFEYGNTESFGNDTRYNISYNLINTTGSSRTKPNYIKPKLQFNSDYWIQNDTIGADNSVGTFLNATGLWDNVSRVKWSFGITSYDWNKGSTRTFDNITSEGYYRFYLTNDTAPFLLKWDNNISRVSGYNLKSHFYTRPGTFYHYRSVVNNSKSTVYGNNITFLTYPEWATVLYINNSYSPSTLNLTWIVGTGSNTTYIERNIISSWNRGDGTLVYNNTGTYYNDTGLSLGTLYYYQAWGYANYTYNNISYYQYSSSYDTESNTTQTVDPPYNGSSNYDTTNFMLNLTWTSGNLSDYDIVVQNNNTWATSPSDGWVRQNSSVNSSNYFNGSVDYSAFFTVWSYNLTGNIYSATGLNIPWGAIEINVYKENEPWIGIGNYTIFLTNNDASETYEIINQNNPFLSDFNDVPNGDDITIQITKAGYTTRSQIHDIPENTYLNITFYLPPDTTGSPDDEEGEPWYVPPEGDDLVLVSTTESVDDHTTDETLTLDCSPDDIEIVYVYNISIYGGWIEVPSDKYSLSGDILTVDASVLDANSSMIKAQYYCLGGESYSSHYIITVEDNAEQSVEDAYVVISRFMNTTNGYETVISGYTDSSGQITADLISDIVYYVVVSKDDYDTTTAFWSPPDISQYEDSQKKFIIYPSETDYPDEIGYDECLVFEGGYSGYTGFVNLSNDDTVSNCGLITNYSIYIYRINTTTNVTTLIYSVNGTNQSVSITFDIFDLNNTFFVTAYINHDVFGGHWNIFYINPSHDDADSPYVHTDKDELDSFFDALFGDNNLGWSTIVGLIALLACLFAFGQRNIGVGIFLTGVVMLGVNTLIGLLLLDAVLCTVIVVFGILVQWKISRKEG